jgi:hypothetical protein
MEMHGATVKAENIQLILDLQAFGITKPLKKKEQNLWRFKPGQTENKTQLFSGTL